AMDADGKLPSLDDVTRRDVLTALARLDFAIAPHPLVPDHAAARVVSTRGVRRLTAAPGSFRRNPRTSTTRSCWASTPPARFACAVAVSYDSRCAIQPRASTVSRSLRCCP